MIVRRLVGVALLVAAYAPLHRLLDAARAGPAGAATRAVAESAWSVGLYGTVLVAGLAFVLSRGLPGTAIAPRWEPFLRAVGSPSPARFALGTGLLAFATATAAALLVHGSLPTSVDEMAQLLHARAVASGRVAMPTHGSPAAFVVQNGIVTADGWVSIYPPAHTILLAAGMRVGAPWLVGPLALGVATAAVARSFDRLAPTSGRVAALLLAITPFWILLGSTHLSHATAAAGLALVLWAALRTRDGGVGGAVATGAAIGLAISARPWVSLVGAAALVATVWLGPGASRPRTARAWLGRAGAVALGGAPFAALLFAWNARLFGSPFTLGYSAAFGPAHGLGLHRDPWGNLYGLREAVAYTGADLVELGVQLLQSPVSVLALVGVALLVAAPSPTDESSDEGHRPAVVGQAVRSRPRDAPSLLAVAGAWAASTVAANALYWHHGTHFGPRMLLESAPAWVALFVVACAMLARRPEARGMGGWVVALTVLGGVLSAPIAIMSSRGVTAGGQPAVPEPLERDAVVLVHGSWASRVGARLAAAGMRRDSIETALRRNDLCAVDQYARWRVGAVGGPAPPVDFSSLPGSPARLRTRELSPGNFARFAAGRPRDPACEREARSDRLGVLELEPLLWRAPPLPGRAMVARDLGPAANARLLQSFAGPAYVYVSADGPAAHGSGAAPRLLPYDVGMELLWRGAAGSPR